MIGVAEKKIGSNEKTLFPMLIGALKGTRTPDPLLRRQMLYPAELSAQGVLSINLSDRETLYHYIPKKASNFLKILKAAQTALFVIKCNRYFRTLSYGAFNSYIGSETHCNMLYNRKTESSAAAFLRTAFIYSEKAFKNAVGIFGRYAYARIPVSYTHL